MDESDAKSKTFLVVECCESEIAVVGDAMTHREHVRYDVLLLLLGEEKKM